MNIDKEDVEWFISLIVMIWLETRNEKKKEPRKHKRRKRK